MFNHLVVLLSLVIWASNISNSHASVKTCVDCHSQQVSNWQQSDHAKAMAVATDGSVLGDFENASTTHYTQKATFYKKDGHFYIDLTEQNKTTTYHVQYTFGHYPLQQYLVPADGGRLQVFPFAWDSQPKSLGGQRWYPNYASEDIKANDRLHWQQPLQNWNGMCADCHSDGLKRNFDVKNDSFDTQWDNINVGCQSCHGDMNQHVKDYNNGRTGAFTDSKAQQQALLTWLLKSGENVARLRTPKGQPATKQQKEQKQDFMNTCFACHALRSPLTDGFKPNQHLMSQFTPSLLAPNLYHADGQIKEEVYVYGSFLQSKMFKEGVTCLDCHDPHSMKIKTESNGLCLQCHSAENYQQEQHTRHPLDSAGGQCVNCHMPETTYMGVDARRDHSFKIPRPDLSSQYNTPNACINCHEDRSNEWAASQLVKWHGHPKRLTNAEQLFINLMHNRGLPLDKHLQLINDDGLPVIKRASAIALLPYSTAMLSDHVIKLWVNHEEPLIRLAVAQVGELLTDEDKLLSYQNLLTDTFKSIRVAAANELITSNLVGTDAFKRAFKELIDANEINSWRGEGNFNQSLIHIQKQEFARAIVKLNDSIKVDPYFASAYVNLADIYRQQQLPSKEKEVYELALDNNPKAAEIHYGYGMFLIRSGDKPSSVKAFKKAVQFDNANSQYAYLYFLALDATGQTNKALNELKRVVKGYAANAELINLGLSFSQKLRDRNSYDFFARLYQNIQ